MREELFKANGGAMMIGKARLVSKQFPMTSEEVEEIEKDGDLVVVDVCNAPFPDNGRKVRVNREAYEAYKKLQWIMEEEFNREVYISSGFRDVRHQEEILEEVTKTMYDGNVEEAKKYVAAPKTSEHHTGMAIDINPLIEESFFKKVTEKVKSTVAKVQGKPYEREIVRAKKFVYDEMASICATCGFIVRYPEGKEDITGVPAEPWHFTYVGSQSLAEEIMKAGTVEEFLGIASPTTETKQHKEKTLA